VTSRELRRFCLVVQYDGSPFHGWQLQSEGRTIQGEIEGVLRRITGEQRTLVGSGRTDAGVHALGQVAAVDLPTRWSAAELRRAVNALLPDEIWLEEVRRVPLDFHPRFHPAGRTYEYRLGLKDEAGSPFHRRWCWDVSELPPDPDLLQRAARLVPGSRSFRKFAKTGQPKRGTRCEVTRAGWADWSGIGLRFEITANRYLHHMVRYLVGTMVDVARGRRALDEMSELLSDPETGLTTSPPAPAHGLFLTAVEYPPERLGDHPDRDPPATDDE
jgi:tRNA pseudouridine38-40 synthase